VPPGSCGALIALKKIVFEVPERRLDDGQNNHNHSFARCGLL
jgi:hypothetical protein